MNLLNIFRRNRPMAIRVVHYHPAFHPSTNHQTLVEVEKIVAERMAKTDPNIHFLGISVDDLPFFLRRQA